MKKKITSITAKDGNKLKFYSWIPNKKIKLAIGIIHGLGEHSSRYNEFAKVNANEYGLYFQSKTYLTPNK